VQKGLVAAVVGLLGFLLPGTLSAEQARFISVDQNPGERAADSAVAKQLGDSLVSRPEELDYKLVIGELVSDSWPQGTVARVTPYAFVVAEMLGAKMEPIATFRSKATGTTTYGAYLVVRQSDFLSRLPTFEEVIDYLRKQSKDGSPAKFVYHDRFSTSSYFLPSLYFRNKRVFAHGDDTDDDVSTIDVEQLRGCPSRCGSSDLVTAVAQHRADLAAVGDGAKAGFEQATNPQLKLTAEKVRFVRLEGYIPNDLLVVTQKARAVKDSIRDKLSRQDGGASSPASSDIDSWILWSDDKADGARTALSDLRRRAVRSAPPVVVAIQSNATAAPSPDQVEAVRQAVRLAGTELVVKSESTDYAKSDVVWELERVHDNALKLRVRYEQFKDAAGAPVSQEFEVLFQEAADITRRVSALINTRMHRIRPVWLYWDAAPIVIRDLTFDVQVREVLPFQAIRWNDPRRNDYTPLGSSYSVARLEKADFNKLELDRAAFPEHPEDKRLKFEPMGRQAFRVLLLRSTHERPLFQALTVAFVALFVLAALGLAWDARKDWGRSSTAAGPERVRPSAALLPDPHTAAVSGPA
jgi:ABC-type phosphate/phosphonate transport system substrate-binding protein